MQRKLSLLAALMAMTATVSAQSFQDGYVQWPASDQLHNYVQQWSNGSLNMEDENFFISRVKPHKQFRNLATQVNQNLNETNDKRLVFWVPVGDTNTDNGANALPNGRFDSETFSMWSYVTHYGDWTSPHGWVPGAFADVAHKNGVAVSGVASIPFGTITHNWNTCLTGQANLDSESIAKFLYYHGVDGLGYNSEFSGNAAAVQKIAAQHEDIIEYLNGKGIHTAEHMWYDGTSISGGISFDRGLGSHNQDIYGSNGKRRSSLFFNYNWGSNRNANLTRSVTAANDMGIDPLYIYAGFNMQGNDPGSGNWEYLSQNNISIGLWGAHDNNMIWLARASNGSAPKTVQKTYLESIERYFGNGPQNPAIQLSVTDGSCCKFTSDFFGMSAMMSARSALNWDLSEEPFISYFNLGNGQFFNWNGERQNDIEWYNIGVQDYLPTWRYWWAPSLLGRNVKKGDMTMKSTFTWDDAYVGGSCLQITGSQDDAYLHLFKTKFGLKMNDVITVRYKLRSGSAEKVSLVLTAEGDETKVLGENYLTVLNSETEVDDEVWQTAEFTISRQLNSLLNNKTLALMALHFTNAKDLDLLIGEVSIKRGTTATPATPEVTMAKVLGSHYKGVDGKLIFNMPNDKAKYEPVYNLDVNTSMYKIYAREEGGEPVFMGVTTSWAALIYNAPFEAGSNAPVQFGVSALSADHKSESEIAWSEPMARGEYTVNNDITINKSVIKPLEGFEIKYVDPIHTVSDWALYDAAGTKVFEVKGATGLKMEKGKGLAETGGYDLVIDEGTANERRFGYYVQVSSEEVGAMPEIYTITLNEEETSEDAEPVKLTMIDNTPTDAVTVGYTGRDADGSASRGVRLNEHFFGCKVSDLGLGAAQSFSVAFWIKYDAFPADDKEWALLDITNRAGRWPVSNWGFCWLRGNKEGKISNYTFRGASSDGVYPHELKYEFEDTKFQPNAWTHIVMTFDYQSANMFRSKLYINGVLQKAIFTRQGNYGGTQEDYAVKNYGINATDWISIGGLPHNGFAINGTLDDFQIWNKAMSDEEVKISMKGLDAGNLPADVLCFWDFEDEPTAGHAFKSKGAKSDVEAYSYDCLGGEQEGQGFQTPLEPGYISGCPFISGTAFPVVTKPVWTARKSVITDVTGNGEKGSAKVSFTKPGDYTLSLSLANSYGEDTKNYPVFIVDQTSGLTGVEAADEMNIYTVTDGLFVEFAEAGAYVVSVYNVQGQLVAEKAAAAEAGNKMQVSLGQNGVYVVKVTKDGETYRSVKVMKK